MTRCALVSCVMPTFNRRRFVPAAIACYQAQTYPHRELVIVDDGTDPVGDLVPADPTIRYVRLEGRLTTGAKRNAACRAARGEIVVHWDDDDWSAPDRVEVQVEALLETGADVCGLRDLLFYEPATDRGWCYRYPPRGRPWVAGGTMCYRRSLWAAQPFPDVRQGEDTRFVWAGGALRVHAIDRLDLYVATIHAANTSVKRTAGPRWAGVPGAEIRAICRPPPPARTPPRTEGEPATAPAVSDVAAASDLAANDGAANRVLVGIPVTVDPAGLRATLESVRAHTPQDHDVVLLPDGPDAETVAALSVLPQPRSGTAEPRGGAACFNRLVAHADADVYVLLESGARVAPGWLGRLLRALDTRPDHGLAGPSTNRAWNEQGGHPAASGLEVDLSWVARLLEGRFGDETATLEPLHSLGEFCYAVRREVVAAVGPADEGYGLGGRWELDFNIRAARAGFRGVWVKAAYVHRAPVTDRRRKEEARHGPAARARYRTRFCGDCPRFDARSGHCSGEDCPGFACRVPPPAAPQRPSVVVGSTDVTVSCVMPTSGRTDLAVLAVEHFRRQDQPGLELIIVDDGAPALERRLPSDPRIRYLPVAAGRSLGAKRGLGCAEARGAVIAQWDDDDWYGTLRLARQVAPILEGRADVTAISGCMFLDVAEDRLLTVSSLAHRRMFAEDVVGGTLVFARSLLDIVSYPDRSLAEDAVFLRAALRSGARLVPVPNEDLFVYIRHGANSWRFTPGRFIGLRHWSVVDRAVMPPTERELYRRLCPTER